MSAQTVAIKLRSDEVDAILAAHGFGGERPASGAAIIYLADPPCIGWANQAATILFESDDPEDLYAQIFAGRGRGGLAESVMRLASDAQPRVERLRLIKGFRSRTLAVTISRSTMPDGRSVVVLAIPTHDLAETATGAFAVSALREPVATSAQSAEPVPDAPSVPAGIDGEGASKPGLSVAGPADDAVLARLATMRSVRFIWQTDADHRIVKLTGGIPEMAGLAGDGALLGRALSDVVEAADHDDAALAAVLASPTPWSGVRGLWPLTANKAAVPVVLGGAPIVQPSGFAGFRGFGVADLTRPVHVAPAASAEADGAAATAGVEPAGPPGRGVTDAGGPEVEDVAAPETLTASVGAPDAPIVADPAPGWLPEAPASSAPTSAASEGSTVAPAARPITFSSKVIALRPYYAMSVVGSPMPPSPAANEPAIDVTPPSEAAPSGGLDGRDVAVSSSEASDAGVPPRGLSSDLSSSERRNFDEIARVLQRAPGQQETETAGNGPAVVEPLRVSATPQASVALDLLACPALVHAGQRVLYANPALLALTCHASVEALQQGHDLVQLLDDHAADGAPDRVLAVPTTSGDAVAVKAQSQAIVWGDSPATLLTFQRVVTVDRKAASDPEPHRREQDIAENRAILSSTILSSLSEAVATVGDDGRLLSLNPAAERLLGVAQLGAVGEPLVALLRPQNRGQVVAALGSASAAEAGPQPPVDMTGRGGGGAPLHLRMTLRSLGLGKLSVTFGDRSEQAALQQELSDVKRELDDAKAMKSDFLAKVSHEVRTPLNAILGFAEVILDERFGPIGNHRYKDYLQDIHASGTNVMRLVTDLLDLSKMEAGRAEMDPTAIDANRVIQDCVNELQVTAHRERVILRLSLMPRLPAVLVDERAFRQVVANVLSNAIKFNEPGGQVIVSTAAHEAGAVAVRIRDTGIGMTDAEIAVALEPFRQINTGRPGGGNGLGLSLTRALVEANRATMSIKSQKDEGTLVEIVFPSCPAEQMRVPAE